MAWASRINLIDLGVLVLGWAIGNAVFNNFEKHLPWWRRILKLVILVGALSLIGLLFSRRVMWVLVLLLGVGQVVLHSWWFPRHGINGLTAEPREKYLALIHRMKGGR